MSVLVLQQSKPQVEEAQAAFAVVCAWCGRERRRSIWRKMRLPQIGKRAHVSHGICPECYERQMAKLESKITEHAS